MFILISVFQELSIVPGELVQNYKNYHNYARQMDMMSFFEPIVKDSWDAYSRLPKIDNISPYYNKLTNTITVPDGIMQSPFFLPVHKSLAFGGFGTIVGKKSK